MAPDTKKLQQFADSLKNANLNVPSKTDPRSMQIVEMIRGAKGVPTTTTGAWRGALGGNSGYLAPLDEPTTQPSGTEWLAELANEQNAVGYTLRAITGLGRGVTNAAYNAMDHSNKFWRNVRSGNAAGAAGEVAAGIGDTAWGAVRGFADSLFPEFDSWTKDLDSRKIMEGGYDVLKSDVYKEFAKGNSILEGAASDKAFTRLGFENFGLDITPAGLVSTGWDIFTDPATYATFGIGGALKGAGKGIASVRAYQKAGKPAELANIPEKALPSPYYKGKAGADAFTAPTYNVANTSPAMYVLKEMGRGFKESHINAWNLTKQRAEERALHGGFFRMLANKITGKTPGLTTYEEVFNSADIDQLVKQWVADVNKTGTRTPEELAAMDAEARAALQPLVERVRQNPEGLAQLSTPEAIARMEAHAAEKGITFAEESADALARHYMASIPMRKRLIKLKKDSNVDVQMADDFSRALENIADPGTPEGDIAAAFDSFKASADNATYRAVLDQILRPVGWKARKKAKNDQQNSVSTAYDLIGASGRGRKKDQDFTPEQVRQPGTKATKTVWKKNTSAEMLYLHGVGSALYKKWYGAGSKLSRQSVEARPNIWTEAEAEESYKRILNVLKKNGVKDDNEITGAMLAEAGVSPALLSARIGFVRNQVNVKSAEAMLLERTARGGYNPITAQAEAVKIGVFPIDAAGRAASGDVTTTLSSVIKTSKEFRAVVTDPELKGVLAKIGITQKQIDALFTTPDGDVMLPRIAEELTRARAAQALRIRNKDIARLQKKYGNIVDDATAQNELTKLQDADAALGKYIKNGNLPSDAELVKAQTILEQMFEDRLAAIEKLRGLGIDAYSPSGMLVTAGLTAGRATGRKSNEELLLQAVVDATNLKVGEKAATKAEAFGTLAEKLNAVKSVSKDKPQIQEAINAIKSIVKNLEERTYQPKELRAISSQINNYTRRIQDNMTFGSSAYNIGFRNRGGEISTMRVPGFLVQAYRSSVGKNGDGGAFAEYIDSLLTSRQLPTMAETPDGQQVKLLANISDVWRGEELTAELLHAISRDAAHQGTKGIKTPETAAEIRKFLENLKADANRMEQELRVTMVDRIIELQGGIEALIKANEDEFITSKTGVGDNMLKAIAKTPEEETIAMQAFSSTTLPVAQVQEKLARLQQLGVPLYTKDGMVVKDGIVDWKKFKPKKFVPEEARPAKALKISPEQEIEMLKTSIYFAGYKAANRNAIVAIERGRAGDIVRDMFPSFATAPEIMKVVEKLMKYSPKMAVKADIVMRARIMLAERLSHIDLGLISENLTRGAVAQVKSSGIKAVKLRKQREELEKLLNRLDEKLRAAGVDRGTETVEGKTLDEVLDLQNPRLFLDWVRNFTVRTSADKDTWELALGHVENLTVVGKGQAYRNVAELFESYRNNRIGLKAGDINPSTGRPVPSEAEIVGLLALQKNDNPIFEPLIGKTAARQAVDAAATGVMPERSKVLRWMRSFGNEPVEMILRRAQENDFIRASQMPNGSTVRKIEQTLEDPQTVHLQFAEYFNSEMNAIYADGLPEIVDLASLMAGQSIRRFIIEGADYEHVFTDALGRRVRADQEAVGARKAMKFNWDKETNLDGWKALLQNLSALAAKNGLESVTPARAEFMTTLALRALRLRDAYYHVRGIFPSTTVGLKEGEGLLLNLFGKDVTDAMRREAKRGVFLSEADVIDVLGKELTGDILFMGAKRSLPVTSLLPAARLVVTAMDSLNPGEWFTSQQMSTLIDTMHATMVNHIRGTTSVSTKTKLTGFDVNPEETYKQIQTVISVLTDENSARKLFESHTINAAYATKMLKYKSLQVTQPIIDGWLRVVQSPNAAVGMKIEETIAAVEALQKAIGQEVDPNMVMMLEMDSKAAMAAHLDPDSLVILREAEEVVDNWETQGIKGVQGKNAARAKSNEARFSLHQAVLTNKVEAAAKANLPEDYMFDVFNEHLVGTQEINHALKWGYGAMERLFAATGMEDLRHIYSPVERGAQNAVDSFNQIARGMAERWAKEAPGRNIMAEAWAIMRDMPEEEMAKAAQAWEQRAFLAQKTNKVSADWDMVKQLDEEAKLFDELIQGDDEQLKRAIIDLFKLHNSILGGGKYSAIMRSGINPRVINRVLHELGAGRQVISVTKDGEYIVKKDGYGFPVGAKEIGAVANAWRDWDLVNPLDALSHLNNALQQAAKVPEMATTLDSMFGVAKSRYENAAAAAKDGLVQLKPVESPSMGKELVYYMQTDSLYYPVQIARELETFSKFVTELKRMDNKGALEKLLRVTSPVQNFAKQQMTLFTLKNWVQNFIGGYWVNWMAGVNNPIMTSARAVKLLQARGINADVLGIDASKLEIEIAKFETAQRKQGFVLRAENDPRSDGIVLKVKGKPSKFDYASLAKVFNDMGGIPPHTQSRDLDLLRPGSTEIETLNSTSSFVKKVTSNIGRGYNKTSGFLGKWASERDAFLRAQLWLDVMMKGNWTSVEQGAREAMRIVDRYHPQLQDLSTFNQKVTRQLVLFFTWASKTLGWILMDMLEKPGRAIAPIKAQYNLTQNEDVQYGEFGTMDPYGVALPGFAQNNLNPLLTGKDGGIYSVSLANPVTDLLGSTGWLSGIEWSKYQPAASNIGTSLVDSFNRFVFKAEPLVLATIMDWSRGESFNGTKFANGAGDLSVLSSPPLLVEEFANRMGLGSYLTMAGAIFPDFFLKASMQDQNNEYIQSEAGRAWINWLTGIKMNQVDTLKNRERGMKEVMAKIEEAFKTGMNK